MDRRLFSRLQYLAAHEYGAFISSPRSDHRAAVAADLRHAVSDWTVNARHSATQGIHRPANGPEAVLRAINAFRVRIK